MSNVKSNWDSQWEKWVFSFNNFVFMKIFFSFSYSNLIDRKTSWKKLNKNKIYGINNLIKWILK